MGKRNAIDHHGPYAIHLDDEQMRAERHKARDIRASQWWKRRCAKGRCHWCHRATPAGELTMDHIIPIARGGKKHQRQPGAGLQGMQYSKKAHAAHGMGSLPGNGPHRRRYQRYPQGWR